jgi:ribosomal protein S18 acetylase RimI-like enzyme
VTNSTFQIRLAQQRDVLKISHILVTSFYRKCPSWLYPVAVWSLSLDLGIRILESGYHYACLVCDVNYEAIATLEVSLKPIPTSNSWFNYHASPQPYIANVAVHPQWRRQGAAFRLLTSVEQKVRSWGFKNIYLHVISSNQEALNLYQLLGYQVYKVDPEFTLNPFNTSKRLLLQKVLA